MIVNTSTVNENDLRALVEIAADERIQSKRGKIGNIVFLVIAILFFCFSVFALVVLVLARTVWHLPPEGNDGFALIMYTIYALASAAIVYLILAKKRKAMIVWRAMHSKAHRKLIGLTSTAYLDENGITVRRNTAEANAEVQYARAAVQGYFEREGVLYIRLRADERTKLVVLHDDAYTEGSKADVLRLMQQCAPETKEVQT